MESVVDTAGKKGLGEIQTEYNFVDTPRYGKWAAELGHLFSGSGIRVGGEMTGE
jgi:hypothetical protein